MWCDWVRTVDGPLGPLGVEHAEQDKWEHTPALQQGSWMHFQNLNAIRELLKINWWHCPLGKCSHYSHKENFCSLATKRHVSFLSKIGTDGAGQLQELPAFGKSMPKRKKGSAKRSIQRNRQDESTQQGLEEIMAKLGVSFYPQNRDAHSPSTS